jgi:hypothetical protein
MEMGILVTPSVPFLSAPLIRHPAPLQSFYLKGPARPSLRRIGIPDSGGDVLAIYLWWTKQQRHRAEHTIEIASSVRSVFDAHEEREPVPPPVRTPFEARPMGCDLRGVGGQFD